MAIVCPSFGDVIAIKNGRNPILIEQEKENPAISNVPNSIYSGNGVNFHLITGINQVRVIFNEN